MSLKSVIKSMVHRTAFASGTSVARARRMNVARIFMFHGVGDSDYPAEVFEKQLRFLKRHFEIISLGVLTERIGSKKPLANSVVLTFDDGLRNNCSIAYPILKKFDAPATFFVCSGLIENQRWLWNQESRSRLRSLEAWRRGELVRRWGANRFTGTDDVATHDVETIIQWMKTLPLKTRIAYEQELRDVTTEFQPTEEQRIQYDVMNWEELRSLDPAFITIGSHTVNHPILSTLEPAELQFEIAESRRLLEQKLNRELSFFCYPNGAFDSNVVAETRKVYRAAVTTEPGFVTGASDLFQLPRIGIVQNTSLVAWRLHRPGA
jgi:peptidoglycan/xylan/chitin deacetylase (PgdA/CDA1 family)